MVSVRMGDKPCIHVIAYGAEFRAKPGLICRKSAVHDYHFAVAGHQNIGIAYLVGCRCHLGQGKIGRLPGLGIILEGICRRLLPRRSILGCLSATE